MRRSLLKDNAQFFEWAMRLLDPLVVAIVGAIAFRLYVEAWEQLIDRYALAIIGMSLVCAALFPFAGLYAPQRGVTLFEEVRRLANAWLLLAATWITFLFFSKTGTEFSRIWSIYWIVAGFLAHLAIRGGIRLTLRTLRRRGCLGGCPLRRTSCQTGRQLALANPHGRSGERRAPHPSAESRGAHQ